MNFIFCMKMNIKVFNNLTSSFLVARSTQNGKFVIFLQYLKKERKNGVDFLITIQLFYKFGLSVLVGMVSHSQSTQNNTVATFLHYLKKEVRNEVDVFVQENIKDFYKFILSYFLVWPGMPKVLKKKKQKTLFSWAWPSMPNVPRRVCNVFGTSQEKG